MPDDPDDAPTEAPTTQIYSPDGPLMGMEEGSRGQTVAYDADGNVISAQVLDGAGRPMTGTQFESAADARRAEIAAEQAAQNNNQGGGSDNSGGFSTDGLGTFDGNGNSDDGGWSDSNGYGVPCFRPDVRGAELPDRRVEHDHLALDRAFFLAPRVALGSVSHMSRRRRSQFRCHRRNSLIDIGGDSPAAWAPPPVPIVALGIAVATMAASKVPVSVLFCFMTCVLFGVVAQGLGGGASSQVPCISCSVA